MDEVTITLKRERAEWLLAKTEKHLIVYKDRLDVAKTLGPRASDRFDLARRDVEQATAIASQIRKVLSD